MRSSLQPLICAHRPAAEINCAARATGRCSFCRLPRLCSQCRRPLLLDSELFETVTVPAEDAHMFEAIQAKARLPDLVL